MLVRRAVARASSLDTDTAQGLGVEGLLMRRNLDTRPLSARNAGKPSHRRGRHAAPMPPYGTAGQPPPPPAPAPVADCGEGGGPPPGCRVLHMKASPPLNHKRYDPLLHRAV